ncbi:MAG: phosphoribosylglycinamide formyltransferase [Planctomycetes bacterium]|nr:phosphoribosylglycinamide formyltransferase [Planctomycetota bacterium]
MHSRREIPRFAVLLSGGGRSLENLHACILRGDVDGEIALVISNTPKAYGLERAERLGIERCTLRPRDFPDRQAWSDAVYRQLREHDIDWVLLLGFLALLPIAPDFEGRVLNIHPSLLPKHGGAGMYGHRVHAAVLEAGDLESGCTVHFCDDEYDRGTVLHQRRCPVHPEDDVESLAARVFEEEKRALPEALRKLARLHR